MKAEERHHLAENDLNKAINQLATGTKRPSSMILLMVGLVVLLGVVYWYWSSTAANRVSRAWIQYYEQRDTLEDAPAQWKSGPAGQAVQLGAADLVYERGFSRLFLLPEQALKEFEASATQYEELSKVASNSDIQLRSLMGAARSNENLGNAAKAIGFYDSVLTKFGSNKEWKDHPLVKDARDRKEKLSASGEDSLAVLYQSWANKLKQVKSDTTAPGMPSMPSIPVPPVPGK